MTKDQNSSPASSETCYKYNEDIGAKDFLRQLYIELSANPDTPIDILSSKFSPVQSDEVECLAAMGDVKANYTCEVGIDRQEEYWDEETYTENGEKFKRLVKKTRTVTDWSPFVGTRDSRELVFVENQHTDSYRAFEVNECARFAIKNTTKNDVTELEDVNFPINFSATEIAKRVMCEKCYEGVKFPGDHQRNQQHSGTANIESSSIYIFPEHSVSYKYKEKDYSARSFASGKLNIKCKTPSESMEIHNDSVKQGSKKTRPMLYAAAGAFVLGLIIAIICVVKDATAGASFGGFLIIAGIATAVASIFVNSYFTRKAKENLISDRQTLKINALTKKLNEEGLKELDSEEIEKIKSGTRL